MHPDRVALITGAAGGIGRVVATHMAKQGFRVGLLDKSAEVEALAVSIREIGGRAESAVADLREPEQITTAVNAVVQALGPVDCLVNNAGITNHVAPLLAMDIANWNREVEINLTAPLHLVRATLPGMIERKWGRIVNVASQAARGGLIFQAGYSATKAGLLGLTRSVTLEHARDGITCNAVLPGLIETEAASMLPEPIRNYALSLTPARRTGSPEEVAHLIAFLCSEGAGFINGAEIDIDGGSHLCPAVLGSLKEIRGRLI